MSLAVAALLSVAMSSKDQEKKVFDWNKAAKILAERKVTDADAGLEGDLFYTADIILSNKKPVKRHPYLASSWATPVLVIDEEEIDCYVMQSQTTWTCNTRWPKSALKIFKRERKKYHGKR